MFSCFTVSNRKETLLLTPKFSENFIYSASSLWNTFRTCPEGFEIVDFAVGIGYVKSKTKSLILRRQKIGDPYEWDNENFKLR